MSFRSVQSKMAQGGVGMQRAGAMLASATRRNMKKAGLSTKHGIPKGVYQKKAFKKSMPGMSMHTECNCHEPNRRQVIPIDKII